MKINYKKLNITIIGVGKVGSAFANELISKGYNVKYLVDSNPGFLKKLSRKLKIKYYFTSVNKNIISDSQIIIISVQDSRIPGLLKSFRNVDLKNKYIFHTSGYFHSEIFKILRLEKNKIGSFHPLQTFNNVSLNNQNLLKDIYFGIQGGILLKKLLIYLSKSLKSKYILINEKDKPLYHFACVFASNFLVSYMSILNKIISSTNIKPIKSIEIFHPIIEKTLSNIKENGLVNALTGPFSRGDINVIKGHLNSLSKNYSELIPIYQILGKEAIKLSESKNMKLSKELKILRKFINSLIK